MSIFDDIVEGAKDLTPIGWAAQGVEAVSEYLPGVAPYKAGKRLSEAQLEAARIQAEAYQQGLEFQKEQYADIKPYLMQSLQGYQNLLQTPEAYKETPGYMFRLQEGLKAIGIPEGRPNLSGAQIKAATRYAQDYATAEYQNQLARYAGLGDLARGVGATGAQYSNTMANLLAQQGAARAQGLTGAAQARASGTLGASRDIMTGLGLFFGGPLGGLMGGGGGGLMGGGGGLSPGQPGAVSVGSYGPYTSPGYVPPGGSFY